MPPASPPCLLRGELFKQGENQTAYKLRWFELSSEGMLSWMDQEGLPAKSSLSLRDSVITFEPDRKPTKSDGEARFGLRITPTNGGRTFSVRTSSDEERRLWAEVMDTVAHPAVSAFRSNGAGRTVRLQRPADGRLGLDLGAQQNAPCVTVVKAGTAAAQAGLLVGDVIVAVDNTVLRTSSIAERHFSRIGPKQSFVLRLASWNREVRMIKQAGISGLTLTSPVHGPGVLIHGVTRDSASASAGLHVGDRVLAVNAALCERGAHEHASQLIIQALQEVKLVVSGVTVAISLQKDTDGRIGIGFHPGQAGRELQGAMISDVIVRSAAHQSGLRNGDVIVAVENDLVTDSEAAINLLKDAARAVNLVVWRSRPDPTDDEAPPATGAAAKEAESTGVGSVPWEYYTLNLQRHSAELPQKVVIYEDLTMGAAGAQT